MWQILIVLFRHHARDPLSFFIEAITRGGYVHAALLMDESTGQICEAYYPCVRYRYLSNAEAKDVDFFAVQGLSDIGMIGIQKYCASSIAAKVHYSIANLFRFLPSARCLIGEGRDTGDAAAVFCSQFVFDAVQRGGGISLLRANSYEVSPSEVAKSPLLTQVQVAPWPDTEL